jgi:hypothetical protein
MSREGIRTCFYLYYETPQTVRDKLSFITWKGLQLQYPPNYHSNYGFGRTAVWKGKLYFITENTKFLSVGQNISYLSSSDVYIATTCATQTVSLSQSVSHPLITIVITSFKHIICSSQLPLCFFGVGHAALWSVKDIKFIQSSTATA